MPDLQLFLGLCVLVLFVLSMAFVSRMTRREREKLRQTLLQSLEQLFEQQATCRNLSDIMALLDAAELQVRHIEHVDRRFAGDETRDHINFLRAQAIVTRVIDKVQVELAEARRTSLPGSKLRYAASAEAFITRWMGHPSLSATDRQRLRERLDEIDDFLMAQPICGEYRIAARMERARHLAEALDGYQQALQLLEQEETHRADEQNLLEDLEERIRRIQQQLVRQGAPAGETAG